MNRQILIGIAGKRGAGKSTVAAMLGEEAGFTEMAFAEPLKWCICEALGISLADLERHKDVPHPVYGVPMRGFLQSVGTEGFRRALPEVWIMTARKRLDGGLRNFQRVVISDVRFENEAQAIRDWGGVIVHVVRQTDFADAHESEAGIAVRAGEIVIDNNGTVANLMEKVGPLLDLIIPEGVASDGAAGRVRRFLDERGSRCRGLDKENIIGCNNELLRVSDLESLLREVESPRQGRIDAP